MAACSIHVHRSPVWWDCPAEHRCLSGDAIRLHCCEIMRQEMYLMMLLKQQLLLPLSLGLHGQTGLGMHGC